MILSSMSILFVKGIMMMNYEKKNNISLTSSYFIRLMCTLTVIFLGASNVLSMEIGGSSQDGIAGVKFLGSALFEKTRDDDIDLGVRIKQVVGNPKILLVDLSQTNLNEHELNSLYQGLLERDQRGVSQMLVLNLSSIHDVDTFKYFLKLFNSTEVREATIKKLMIKVGFNITQDFIDECLEDAPFVISKGMTIID